MKIAKSNLFSVSKYSCDWLSWEHILGLKNVMVVTKSWNAFHIYHKWYTQLHIIKNSTLISQRLNTSILNLHFEMIVFIIQCSLQVFYLNQSLLIIV